MFPGPGLDVCDNTYGFKSFHNHESHTYNRSLCVCVCFKMSVYSISPHAILFIIIHTGLLVAKIKSCIPHAL